MSEDKIIPGSGEAPPRWCFRCHTPLSPEPDVIRRMFSNGTHLEGAWFVRYCRNPACGAANLEECDDQSRCEEGAGKPGERSRVS